MNKCIFSIILLVSICLITFSISAVECDSNEEVINTTAEMIRDKILDRQDSFKITTQYLCKAGEEFSSSEYAETIYNKAISEEFSTSSSSGSYFSTCIKSYGYGGTIKSVENLEDGSKLYTVIVHGSLTYHTTKEQEAELDTEIQKWVTNNIDAQNDSDFDKIFKVYKYITENVRYDYSYQNYSAYNAFFDKTAVCQGYAGLLHKMLKESGINDTVIITGLADNGIKVDRHAWNIVKLGNECYYLDSTWDEGNQFYWNFLRGAQIFDELHTRGEKYNTDEFNRLYPISNNDFSFITNKVNERNGMLKGFDISSSVLKKEKLLNDGYFRDDVNIEIEIQSNNETIGTDARIKIKKDGIELNNYIVVIYGDINGDGTINAFDALYLIKGINKKVYFENPYIIEAGRIVTSENNMPTALDALAIIKYANGKFTINQSK